MKDKDYIVHTKKSVEIPNDIIDKINDILQKPCTKQGYSGYTNWEAMVSQLTTVTGKTEEQLMNEFPFEKLSYLGTPDADVVIKWGKD